MAIDEYTGGPGAALARGVSSFGDGLVNGMQILAQRNAQAQNLSDQQQQQKIQLANLMAQSATEFPGASEADRAKVVYSRLGLPVPSIYTPPPAPTGPPPPSMLAGPHGNPVPSLDVPQIQSFVPPPRPVAAPQPVAPPAPVVAQGPPTAPQSRNPVPNSPYAMFGGAQPGQSMTAPVPPTVAPQPAPPVPVPSPPVAKWTPPSFPPIMPPSMNAQVPPAPVSDDILQRPAPLGDTAQQMIWGVRNQPRIETNNIKTVQDLATDFDKQSGPSQKAWLVSQINSNDPKTQSWASSKLQSMTDNQGNFTPSTTVQGQHYGDQATHYGNQDTNAAQRTDIYGQRVNSLDSMDDVKVQQIRASTGHIVNADMISTLGKVGTLPPQEQAAAVNDYNSTHPDDPLPVPDGKTVPYYTPSTDVAALMNQRDAEAKNLGLKSQYYPDLVMSQIAKNKSDAVATTKNANTKALYDQALTNQMGATNQAKQASLNALMDNAEYKANFNREASANAELDRLDAQDRLASYDLASQKMHPADYDRQIQESNLRRQQLNADISDAQAKRGAIEANMGALGSTQPPNVQPSPMGATQSNATNGNAPPSGFVPVPNGKGAYVDPATKTYWYNGRTFNINK